MSFISEDLRIFEVLNLKIMVIYILWYFIKDAMHVNSFVGWGSRVVGTVKLDTAHGATINTPIAMMSSYTFLKFIT